MKGSPTTAVHQGNRDERHQHHHDPNTDGGVLGRGFAQSRGDEEVGGVVEDGVYPGELLGELHHDGDGQRHPQ